MAVSDTAFTPEAGDESPPRMFGPLTRTHIVRYAGASGDFNPIHHDDEFARAAGFPSVFSIGMLQAALLATYATDWLGAERIRRFRVRFVEQVWPGDELTCTGTVTSVESTSTGISVEVDLVARRQTGGIAVSGDAVFHLEEES